MQTGMVPAAEGRQRGLFCYCEALGPDLFDRSSSVFPHPCYSTSPPSNQSRSHVTATQGYLVKEASGSICPSASDWFCLSKQCRKQVCADHSASSMATNVSIPVAASTSRGAVKQTASAPPAGMRTSLTPEVGKASTRLHPGNPKPCLKHLSRL